MTQQQSIFSRAWRLIWRNPWVLLFGILAGLRFEFSSDTTTFLQGGSWFMQDLLLVGLPHSVTVLWTTGLSFGLWVLGLVARAGLIQATVDLDRENSPIGFGVAWGQGVAALWQVMLMQVIIWSPFILLGLGSQVFSPQIEAWFLNLGQTSFEQTGGNLVFLICGIFLVVLPLIVLMSITEGFAYRAIVLERLKFWPAIHRGWTLGRSSFGEIVSTGLGVGILSVIYGFVVMIPLFAFAMPILFSQLAFAFQQCGELAEQSALTECMANTVSQDPRVMIGAVILSIVSAVLGSLIVTYSSTVFTLLYQRLAGLPKVAAIQEVAV